jgi:hypothetical protein
MSQLSTGGFITLPGGFGECPCSFCPSCLRRLPTIETSKDSLPEPSSLCSRYFRGGTSTIFFCPFSGVPTRSIRSLFRSPPLHYLPTPTLVHPQLLLPFPLPASLPFISSSSSPPSPFSLIASHLLFQVMEMTTWSQLGIHSNRPVLLLNIDSFFTPLQQQIQRSVDEGFIAAKNLAFIKFIDGPDDADWGRLAVEALDGWVWDENAGYKGLDWGQA